MTFRRRGFLYVTGAVILISPPAVWLISSFPTTPVRDVVAPVERVAAEPQGTPASLAALAQQDPMALVRLGRERYNKQVREYRCVLLKQEWLGSKLSKVQEIELRYRESPKTVYMLWTANADQVKRALYIEDSRLVDDKGRPVARIEPAGAIVRLFVKDVYMPIHGPDARKASRRTIDECGFRATLDLLEHYNAKAEERGVLDLGYGGTGEVDGRPTYVLVRNLPYEGPDGPYPDARMVLHLDQEWLLPVAVYSYADHEEKELLGSYVFMKVELDPGFDDTHFAF